MQKRKYRVVKRQDGRRCGDIRNVPKSCKSRVFGTLSIIALQFYTWLFSSLFFHPLACVDKCLYPWGNLVAVNAVLRIVAVLPREDGAFQVRHDGQVASVGAGYCRNGVVGAVRIARIFVVGIFCHYIVFVLIVRQ